MDYFYDINIGKINIITQKIEDSGLFFKNPRRFGAGFVYFLKGTGSFYLDGKFFCEVKPSTFIHLEKDDNYEFRVNTPTSYVVSEFEISGAKTALPRIVSLDREEGENIFNINKRWAEKDEFCYLETRILLLNFYNKLLMRLKSRQTATGVMSVALSYIHRNYNVNFDHTALANECGISDSYLRKKFKQEFNMTVMEYRENIRINHAKTMLKSGEFKINEIADSLGYCDVYHFSKNFKKATGKSPAHYYLKNKD